ncbi:hypothetical protein CH274_15330 [Rhodococcus sp. 06-418-5]|uniref:hypothetical protein n=1 Tax=Rhodococcus sp. 06-418-5 TaxID=2022507 RepID=UPI000B9A4839|nr:hypothetical protein [Rhodococcus sp. 06-418-5]OZC80540.1 hypothetical protein CH274_15330 [Rhodococcus sp. 06-418-5]
MPSVFQNLEASNAAIAAAIAERDAVASANAKGIPALGVRRDTDGAVPADGDWTALQTDEAGRLKVAGMTASFPATVGNLAAVNDVVVVDVSRASNIVFHVKNTGTAAMAAGVCAFEASLDSTNGIDGTWFSILAARTNASTVESATPALALAVGVGSGYAWEASVNAYKYVRVRCTTAVTANSIATWTLIRGAYATEPAPAIQTHPVSQSGVFTTTPVTPSQYLLTTAATTNAAVVKASGGNLFEMSCFNPSASAVFWKIYNKASAPTVGTDVPILTIPVAAGALAQLQFGALGKRLGTGIASALTAAAAATDTAVIAAGIQLSASFT